VEKFLLKNHTKNFVLCCILSKSSLPCSSLRIKAFGSNYDKFRLLREGGQEKSIMGLNFDNILSVSQTTG
jgi:hypothetical protein